MKRQPIVAILGHVDHGKTTLLDHIRGSSVAAREAGGITQHIGATEVPVDVIKEMCGTLLDKFKVSITIPGLLFIDTPGHHAFTSLRRRGGALADIAILVVDIKQPLMPQAVEAIKILRLFRVPFVVAANKIDTLPGWRSTKGPHLQNFTKQKPEAITKLDNAIYKLIGSLAEQNFDSERFDRVTDFTRQITIIPISAKTGEGIPELLAIITGLAQRYMEKQLTIAEESPGKGTILEVKEDPGLGITIDCILYDGKLRRGDTIAMLSKDGEVIQTRVRGLLRPKPLDEIRDPRNRFTPIQDVTAAAGIKILAPNLEKALAGSPIQVLKEDSDLVVSELKKEIEQVKIDTELAGIIVKTDTIGALEAVVNELKSLNIPVKKAAVGDITKIDVIEASVIKEEKPMYAVILGFNVRILPDAKQASENLKVKIFNDNVIYKLIEDYQEWKEAEEKRLREAEMEGVIRPGKIHILPGYVFRHSKPVVVGVEVKGGTIKPEYPLMREDGKAVGKIKSLQDRGEPLKEARLGSRIAVSIVGPTLGRQIREGDTLYVDLPNRSIELLETKLKNTLTPDEEETLHEIKRIKKIIPGPWRRV